MRTKQNLIACSKKTTIHSQLTLIAFMYRAYLEGEIGGGRIDIDMPSVEN